MRDVRRKSMLTRVLLVMVPLLLVVLLVVELLIALAPVRAAGSPAPTPAPESFFRYYPFHSTGPAVPEGWTLGSGVIDATDSTALAVNASAGLGRVSTEVSSFGDVYMEGYLAFEETWKDHFGGFHVRQRSFALGETQFTNGVGLASLASDEGDFFIGVLYQGFASPVGAIQLTDADMTTTPFYMNLSVSGTSASNFFMETTITASRIGGGYVSGRITLNGTTLENILPGVSVSTAYPAGEFGLFMNQAAVRYLDLNVSDTSEPTLAPTTVPSPAEQSYFRFYPFFSSGPAVPDGWVKRGSGFIDHSHATSLTVNASNAFSLVYTGVQPFSDLFLEGTFLFHEYEPEGGFAALAARVGHYSSNEKYFTNGTALVAAISPAGSAFSVGVIHYGLAIHSEFVSMPGADFDSSVFLNMSVTGSTEADFQLDATAVVSLGEAGSASFRLIMDGAQLNALLAGVGTTLSQSFRSGGFGLMQADSTVSFFDMNATDLGAPTPAPTLSPTASPTVSHSPSVAPTDAPTVSLETLFGFHDFTNASDFLPPGWTAEGNKATVHDYLTGAFLNGTGSGFSTAVHTGPRNGRDLYIRARLSMYTCLSQPGDCITGVAFRTGDVLADTDSNAGGMLFEHFFAVLATQSDGLYLAISNGTNLEVIADNTSSADYDSGAWDLRILVAGFPPAIRVEAYPQRASSRSYYYYEGGPLLRSMMREGDDAAYDDYIDDHGDDGKDEHDSEEQHRHSTSGRQTRAQSQAREGADDGVSPQEHYYYYGYSSTVLRTIDVPARVVKEYMERMGLGSSTSTALASGGVAVVASDAIALLEHVNITSWDVEAKANVSIHDVFGFYDFPMISSGTSENKSIPDGWITAGTGGVTFGDDYMELHAPFTAVTTGAVSNLSDVSLSAIFEVGLPKEDDDETLQNGGGVSGIAVRMGDYDHLAEGSTNAPFLGAFVTPVRSFPNPFLFFVIYSEGDGPAYVLDSTPVFGDLTAGAVTLNVTVTGEQPSLVATLEAPSLSDPQVSVVTAVLNSTWESMEQANGPDTNLTDGLLRSGGVGMLVARDGSARFDSLLITEIRVEDSTPSRYLNLTADDGFYSSSFAECCSAGFRDFNHPNVTITGMKEYSLREDDTVVLVDLPFSVDFYGEASTSVEVSSNGILGFPCLGDSFCCEGGPLNASGGGYNTELPNLVLAPFWTDLGNIEGRFNITVRVGDFGYVPPSDNDTESTTTPDTVWISFVNTPIVLGGIPSTSSTSGVTFHVLLRSNGTIQILYGRMPGHVISAVSIGLRKNGSVASALIDQETSAARLKDLSGLLLTSHPAVPAASGNGDDDGESCVNVNATAFDIFADGWEGAAVTFTSKSTGAVKTLPHCATGNTATELGLCLTPGHAYTVDSTALGQWPDESGWEICGRKGSLYTSGVLQVDTNMAAGANCSWTECSLAASSHFVDAAVPDLLDTPPQQMQRAALTFESTNESVLFNSLIEEQDLCLSEGCHVVQLDPAQCNRAFSLCGRAATVACNAEQRFKICVDSVGACEVVTEFTPRPTASPTYAPTEYPTPYPSRYPTPHPTVSPSVPPTPSPTASPTTMPTPAPTAFPTVFPSPQPTQFPTPPPTESPTQLPTAFPTESPTAQPTPPPTASPSAMPTPYPTALPTAFPSPQPSLDPSAAPSSMPSPQPSASPSASPTLFPSFYPTLSPSVLPTEYPTPYPTASPSTEPTPYPSNTPSQPPTFSPSASPTLFPSFYPTLSPSVLPTEYPTPYPTASPSTEPTPYPSNTPSQPPTFSPTLPRPSSYPTPQPTDVPSVYPTLSPSVLPTEYPTSYPTLTRSPTATPTLAPSLLPTEYPTSYPTNPNATLPSPTLSPTSPPSTMSPTLDLASIADELLAELESVRGVARVVGTVMLVSGGDTAAACTEWTDFVDTQISFLSSANDFSAMNVTQYSLSGNADTLEVSCSNTSVLTAFAAALQARTTYVGVCDRVTYRVFSCDEGLTFGMCIGCGAQENMCTAQASATVLVNPCFDTSTNAPSLLPTYAPYAIHTPHPTPRAVHTPHPTAGERGFTMYPTYIYSMYPSHLLPQRVRGSDANGQGTGGGDVHDASDGGRNSADSASGHAAWQRHHDLSRLHAQQTLRSLTDDATALRDAAKEQLAMATGSQAGHRRLSGTDCVQAVVMEYEPKQLYPLFNVTRAQPDSTTVDMELALEFKGAVWCRAYLTDIEEPGSAGGIVTEGELGVLNKAATGPAGEPLYDLTISDLEPLTEYTLYCVTETLGIAARMPFDVAIETPVDVQTECCHSVKVSATSQALQEDVLSAPISVSLSGEPSADVFISIEMAHGEVSGTGNDSTCPDLSSDSAFNASDTVAVASTDYLFIEAGDANSDPSFVVVPLLPGCLYIRLHVDSAADEFTFADTDRLNTTLALRVAEVNEPLSAPEFVSALFSSKGTTLVVTLDSFSDSAADLNLLQPFRCSRVLDFPSAYYSRCTWISSKEIQALLPSTATVSEDKLPNVGDEMTIVDGGAIKALCTATDTAACADWPTMSDTDTVTIDTGDFVVTPVAVLSGPSTFGACGTLSLDASSSTGAAGRSWSRVQWSLVQHSLAANHTSVVDVQRELDRASNNSETSVDIAASMLSPDQTYTFEVQLTNFLGSSRSSNFLQVSVSDDVGLPQAVFAGSNEGETFRNESLELFVQGVLPDCDGLVLNQLSYKWNAYNELGQSLGLVSATTDPRYFVVEPFELEFTVGEAVVFSATIETADGLQSTAKRDVYVADAGVLAVLDANTKFRTVRAFDRVELDANQSLDLNEVNAASSDIDISWTCVELAPLYGAACENVTLTSSSIQAFDPYSLPQNSTLRFSVTARSRHDTRLFSRSSTTIFVEPSNPPFVAIELPNTVVNVGSKLALDSTINATEDFTVQWSLVAGALVDGEPLEDRATTQTLRQFSAGAVSMPVVLAENSMLAEVQYEFVLSAWNGHTDTPPSEVSEASGIVVPNGPPTSGSVAAVPPAGVELNTTFRLRATSWEDRPDDLPITYEFSLFVGIDEGDVTQRTPLRARREFTFVDTVLPRGPTATNQTLTIIATVYDRWDASVESSAEVVVSESDQSTQEVTAHVVDAFEIVTLTGNLDLGYQVLSAASPAANAANCSLAPDAFCASLNRSACTSTPHTCSECLTGNEGVAGDSNTQCVGVEDSAALLPTGAFCNSSAQCQLQSCNPVTLECEEPEQICPNDCNTESGRGACHFVSKVTGQQWNESTCGVLNTQCEAQCQCNPGSFGQDCSLSESEALAQAELRFQMLSGLGSLAEAELVTISGLQGRAGMLSALLTVPSELNVTSIEISLGLAEGLAQLASQGFITEDLAASTWEGVSSLMETESVQSSENGSDSAATTVREMLLALQGTLFVGEADLTSIHGNFRATASALYSNDANGTELLPPLLYSSEEPPSFVFPALSASGTLPGCGASAGTEVGVVLIYWLRDIHPTSSGSRNGESTTTPIFSVGVLVADEDVAVNDTTLAADDASIDETALVTLPQVQPVLRYIPDIVTVTCPTSALVAAVNVTCPDGTNVTIPCSGNEELTHEVECPTGETVPQCLVWDGTEYSDTLCTPVVYSEDNVTCSCDAWSLLCLSTSSLDDGEVATSSERRHRRLAGDDATDDAYADDDPGEASYVPDFASVGETLGASFTGTISNIARGKLDLGSAIGVIVLMSLSVGLSAALMGFFYFMDRKERQEEKRRLVVAAEQAQKGEEVAAAGAVAVATATAAVGSGSGAGKGDGKDDGAAGELTLDIVQIEAAAEAAAAMEKRTKEAETPWRTARAWLEMSMPSDVRLDRHMLEKFWTSMKEDHFFLTVFYRNGQLSRAQKMVVALTTLLSLMWAEALCYALLYPDSDPRCENIPTHDECVSEKMPFDSSQQRCVWNPANDPACEFNEQETDVVVMAWVSAIAGVLAVPFTFIAEILTEEVISKRGARHKEEDEERKQRMLQLLEQMEDEEDQQARDRAIIEQGQREHAAAMSGDEGGTQSARTSKRRTTTRLQSVVLDSEAAKLAEASPGGGAGDVDGVEDRHGSSQFAFVPGIGRPSSLHSTGSGGTPKTSSRPQSKRRPQTGRLTGKFLPPASTKQQQPELWSDRMGKTVNAAAAPRVSSTDLAQASARRGGPDATQEMVRELLAGDTVVRPSTLFGMANAEEGEGEAKDAGSTWDVARQRIRTRGVGGQQVVPAVGREVDLSGSAAEAKGDGTHETALVPHAGTSRTAAGQSSTATDMQPHAGTAVVLGGAGPGQDTTVATTTLTTTRAIDGRAVVPVPEASASGAGGGAVRAPMTTVADLAARRVAVQRAYARLRRTIAERHAERERAEMETATAREQAAQDAAAAAAATAVEAAAVAPSRSDENSGGDRGSRGDGDSKRGGAEDSKVDPTSPSGAGDDDGDGSAGELGTADDEEMGRPTSAASRGARVADAAKTRWSKALSVGARAAVKLRRSLDTGTAGGGTGDADDSSSEASDESDESDTVQGRRHAQRQRVREALLLLQGPPDEEFELLRHTLAAYRADLVQMIEGSEPRNLNEIHLLDIRRELLQRLDEAWGLNPQTGDFDVGNECTQRVHKDAASQTIAALQRTRARTEKWLGRFRAMTDEERNVKLLQLLIKDRLGPSQGRIFRREMIRDMEETEVQYVSEWSKAAAWAVIAGLNVGMVVYLIFFAGNIGRKASDAWVSTFAWLFLQELFLLLPLFVLFMRLVSPALIYRDLQKHIVQVSYLFNVQDLDGRGLNALAYLSVGHRLAHIYRDLPASRIVLSYSSPLPSWSAFRNTEGDSGLHASRLAFVMAAMLHIFPEVLHEPLIVAGTRLFWNASEGVAAIAATVHVSLSIFVILLAIGLTVFIFYPPLRRFRSSQMEVDWRMQQLVQSRAAALPTQNKPWLVTPHEDHDNGGADGGSGLVHGRDVDDDFVEGEDENSTSLMSPVDEAKGEEDGNGREPDEASDLEAVTPAVAAL